tara:strand:+ start:312 stop:1010 length:699 start_codon:yes stop_codon:yes gene_type:complete
MKTLSLTNRRILVGFLLVGLMIIKSTLLEKTKEGFNTEDKCVLDSTGDKCSYKNKHNYSENFKKTKYYVEKGFRKDLKNSWKIWDKDAFFIIKLIFGYNFLYLFVKDIVRKYLKYVWNNISLMTSMFEPINRYKMKCFYACEKNKKKCENHTKFLNYSIVKLFINNFNNITGQIPIQDLFEKCKDEGSYKYIECCTHKTVWYTFYKVWFFRTLGSIFIIFLLIFLYIFYKKL